MSYTFKTNVIEWVEQKSQQPLFHDDIRSYAPGRFNRLRRWLFERLSEPWHQKTDKLQRVTYSHEHIGHLISEAIGNSCHKLSEIKSIIMSPETAFQVSEMIFNRSIAMDIPVLWGKFSHIYDIPVIVLSAYQHDDILIVPKS